MDTIPRSERIYIHSDHVTHSCYFAIDQVHNTIIALQMLGWEQSVKAAWAHLVTNGKQSAMINKYTVILDGSKKHVQFKSSLPENGRFESWLIHKQAIPEKAHPGIEPFFYIFSLNTNAPYHDEEFGTQFITMLDRVINMPILPEWSHVLWEKGIERNMIMPIPPDDCRNMVAYRIAIVPTMWQRYITQELRRGHITF
jgi:hypothetical protein